MPATTRVAVFHPDTAQVFLCVEQPHPADPTFLAYQQERDGLWLGVSPTGGITFTAQAGSWQAFTRLVGTSYILADRTAPVWHGGAYRLGVSEVATPSGPVA